MTMLFPSMAWRNVWRHRRRSVLTIATISLGLAFYIFMRGIGDGFHEQMVDNSVRAHIGHIEIHRRGYHDDPGINKTLPDPARVEAAIRRLPALRGYSFRVLGDGLASTAANSAGVSIVGVDPEQERTVTTIYRGVVKGKYLDPKDHQPVLIGERLAKLLQVKLGDSLVLLVQAADGSMGGEKYLFALEGRLTEAALLVSSSHEVDRYQQMLEAELAGSGVEVLPWYVIEPYIQQFIQLDDAFFYIIVVILFIVISVGILNTILMSVLERVREFGVMMSLGMKPRQVVNLVVQEAAFLGLVSVLIGGTLGCALTVYYGSAGINLAQWAEGAAAFGMTSPIAYPKLTAANLVLSNLSVLIVVMLVALYPALHAARLRPVEAIRHV